jgi:hypothetical protein
LRAEKGCARHIVPGVLPDRFRRLSSCRNLGCGYPSRPRHTRPVAFAIFYTKVHDRVLTPLFAAGQPQAPPALTTALRSIEQIIDDRLAAARLPAAT